MWNSRSPGVDGAWWRGPSSAMNGCSSAGRGPANNRSHASEPIEVTTDRCLVGIAKTDGAHQSRDVGERIVHGFLAAVVDGGDQEDGRWGQRRQHRLRQWIGHNWTLA